MDLILVGGFSEIVELCELAGHTIVGTFDSYHTGEFNGIEIFGNDEYAVHNALKYNKYPVVISPDLPRVRKEIVSKYKNAGYQFCNIISPSAIISRTAKLGNGIIIQSGVNISSNVHIGNFTKINTHSNVMHDVVIGNFCTVAPNAVLLGRVTVEDMVYVGANATVLPSLNLGECSLIGAGSVVTKNVGESVVCAGNPARELKK